MALLTMLYRGNATDAPGANAIQPRVRRTRIASLELDATLSEMHQGDVEVTRHPVETGGEISDHSYAKPRAVTVEGIVSDHPLTGSMFGRGSSPRGSTGPVDAAYQELERIRGSGQLVALVTTLATYQNMRMTSLSIPRDGKRGTSLRFTAAFTEVRFVSSQTVTLRATKLDGAKSKIKTGKVKANPASAAMKEKSYALQAVEAVKGLFSGGGG